MQKRQKPISAFFAASSKKKCVDNNDSNNTVTANAQTSENNDRPSTSTNITIKENTDDGDNITTSSCISSLGLTNINDKQTSTFLDIGNFLGKSIDDDTKKRLLTEYWAPSKDYNFPFSVRQVSGKEIKNFVSSKHLEMYEWLVLSDVKKGLFCKYCTLFVTRNEGGYQKNISLKALVTTPLTNFKKLMGIQSDLENHSKCQYHKDAVTSGKMFLKTQENFRLEVVNQLQTSILQQKIENRERLLSVIKTIIFLGTENIPLRGHRDDGPLLSSENTNSEGTFRSLLRFRIDAGDKMLDNHLKICPSNATYISKTTQNNIIKCCHSLILDTVLQNTFEAKYYSIIFDETTDLSGKSQISLALRYFDIKENRVNEEFIGFVDAFEEASKEISDDVEVSIDAKILSSIVVKALTNFGLNLKNCVGVGTDGCPLMLAENGAVKKILETATNAKQTPCYSHKLNNSISKSNKVPIIQKTVSFVRETTKFFKCHHPKRNAVLIKFLGTKLSPLCETRWVDRHDSILHFTVSVELVIEALEKISEWKDRDTSSKAFLLRNSISTFEFICGLCILSDILTVTQPLSVILQKKDIDLHKGANLIKTLIMCLEEKRNEAENQFKIIFEKAKAMCVGMQIPIEKSRFERNHPIQDIEEYYRVVGYIPLIESILEDLKTRFSKDVQNLFHIAKLLPPNIITVSFTNIKLLIPQLADDFIKFEKIDKRMLISKLEAELLHWQQKWKICGDHPDNVVNALLSCDPDIYPNLRKIFIIFVSMPVSNATAERSFSTLRRIKTWLRSTMTEDRLNGLAMMHIHRDKVIDPNIVLDKFASQGNHKLLI